MQSQNTTKQKIKAKLGLTFFDFMIQWWFEKKRPKQMTTRKGFLLFVSNPSMISRLLSCWLRRRPKKRTKGKTWWWWQLLQHFLLSILLLYLVNNHRFFSYSSTSNTEEARQPLASIKPPESESSSSREGFPFFFLLQKVYSLPYVKPTTSTAAAAANPLFALSLRS